MCVMLKINNSKQVKTAVILISFEIQKCRCYYFKYFFIYCSVSKLLNEDNRRSTSGKWFVLHIFWQHSPGCIPKSLNYGLLWHVYKLQCSACAFKILIVTVDLLPLSEHILLSTGMSFL